MSRSVTFTILGKPVTKKNSARILRSRTGRPFVMPSAAYLNWENTAVLQLQSQNRGAPAITGRVELTAVIYRKRATGDLDNHLSSVCDALQKAKVIANDRLVASFGASRLDKDAARPRVEITIASARKQPWDCEHANECPMRCPCKADCYCKENMCADAGEAT
jgi:Holliday junction resolvase RusA-like endonuclease